MLNEKTRLLADRYLIKEKLSGDGATGYVYLAEDTSAEGGKRLCAVKELDPQTKNPEEHRIFCERFKDEETYLRVLDGFNGQIPKLYNSFSVRGEDGKETRYIVQEYIEGKTLSYKLKEERVLSESKVKEILTSLLPVIAHIHSEGFIHRDINPSNIILRSRNDLPVLIDFGAVKDVARTFVASAEDANHRTVVIGKKGYMAPEHLDGHPEFHSDLYSLGVTAIELLSGVRPKDLRRDPATKELLWRQHVPNVSWDFAAVIDQATQESAGLRYSDAQAMLKALDSVAVPAEGDDEIRQRLGNSLSSLLERRPKAPPGNYRKCYDAGCAFKVALEEEYCLSCGAVNAYRLGRNQLHLLRRGAEGHLNLIEPGYSERWAIRLGKFLKSESGFNIRFGLLSVCVGIGIIVGWYTGEGFVGTITSVLQVGLTGLFCGLLLFGTIWLVERACLMRYESRLAALKRERATIYSELERATEENRGAGTYLNQIDEEISKRLKDISTEETAWKNRLSFIQNFIKERIGKPELQKEAEKFQLAVAASQQKYKKYQVKRLEIKLLRLHNELKAKIGHTPANEKAESILQGATNPWLEQELGELNKLVNQMYDELQETNAVNSENGRDWVARIFCAREVLKESISLLITHHDLRFMNRESVTVEPPKEFGQHLNLLNVYITFDDFYKEYQALQSK